MEGAIKCRANGDAQLDWADGNNRGHYGYFDHREFELTRESAVTRANALRDAKIQSLEAQVERLRGMVFA